MQYKQVAFAFNGTNGEIETPRPVSNKEFEERPFYGETPQKTYLEERIPWSAWDGFINMGLLPVLLLAGALWGLRTRNFGAAFGMGLGGAMLVGSAFIKYGDLAWGGLIANVFATGAIFAVVGLAVALFGSILTSLLKRN
jgi:hypothetical protein